MWVDTWGRKKNLQYRKEYLPATVGCIAQYFHLQDNVWRKVLSLISVFFSCFGSDHHESILLRPPKISNQYHRARGSPYTAGNQSREWTVDSTHFTMSGYPLRECPRHRAINRTRAILHAGEDSARRVHPNPGNGPGQISPHQYTHTHTHTQTQTL